MAKRPLSFACLGIAALLFFLVNIRPASYTDYSAFQKETLTVTGKVYQKETVTQKDGQTLVLYLKLSPAVSDLQNGSDTGPLGKKVICYLKEGQQEPEMGSTVQISGKFSCFERASNPGQFDAYSYYQISGISYRLNQAKILAKTVKYNKLMEKSYLLKGFLSGKFSQCLPEKEASVMQTMLLGEKGGMDKELKNLYQRNGIAHILAISGLHISMIGMGLYKMLRKCGVPMKASAVLSAGLMFCYGVMTGFSVSAVRAIIMFSMHMAAVVAERTYDMLTAVAVAAVLVLIRQPLYLSHSGFVFSFGCVLGIGLVLPALTEGEHVKHPAVKMVLGGLGMAVITLPVYLWFYYQFPVYSILLNLFIIPMMSFLMAAGLLVLLCSLLCPALAVPFTFFIKAILVVYEGGCKISESLPGNLLTTGKPERWQIVVYLLALILLIFLKKKVNMAVRWVIMAFSVLLLTFHPKVGLKLTFLDVGQGDCICIENGNGKSYLIDGGSSSVSSVGEYRMIPFLKSQGISELEAVFVTHPDADHCNGVKELMEIGEQQGITVRHLVLPDISQDTKNEMYLELEQGAQKSGILVSYISRGQKITDGKLTLTCVHPSMGYQSREANEYSIVLGLTYGNFSAMLTGDVEGNGEQEVTQILQKKDEIMGLTVLKAAHHGSKNSTSNEFLDCLNPVYTVVSCGENNSYGHPHEELMERLMEHDTGIFLTYDTGAVSFATDGRRVKLTKFLKG